MTAHQPALETNSSKISPVIVSFLLHLLLVMVVLAFVFYPKPKTEIVNVDVDVKVIEQPKVAPQADIDLTRPPPAKPEPAQPKARKVFGVTRDTLTSNAETSDGIAVKQGNTVAAAPDNEKLTDEDASRLPIPVEEYLISAPPQLLESYKPQYPPEARARNIEGAVRVEILIDRDGMVKDARVLSGLGFGTEEAALEAARRLRFKPAEAEGKAVAVKIQFVINFELE